MRKARDFAEALALIMKDRGWSQVRLAHELDKDQPWVSRAVRGKRDPGTRAVRAYLDKVGWELYMAPKAEEIDSVKRRDFMSVVTSIAFIPSSNVGPYQDPAYVRTLAARLRQTTEQIGGGSIASAALRHLAHVRGAINSPNRALRRAACDLSNSVAVVMRDAHRPNDAERVASLTLSLARSSGHADGAAGAFEDLSALSQQHDPNRAVEYVRRGLLIRDLNDERRARLNAMFGWALAATRRHGVERASRKALDTSLETVLGVTDIPPYVRGMVLGYSGIALADFARYDESRDHLRETTRIFADSPTMYGLWTAHQARIDLRAADPSRAAERMRSLARVVPLVTSGHLDRLVGGVLRDSAPWAEVPEMETAIDELRSVTSRPR